jgi:TldD protein
MSPFGIDRPLRRRRFLGLVTGAATVAVAGPLERFLGVREALASGSSFPLDGATASRVLQEARARGAGFADLYLENRIVTRITLADGSIEGVEQGIFAGCGVRAVDGDRTGYAFVDSFEPALLIDAARNAAAIASAPLGQTSPIIFQLEAPHPRVRFLRPMDQVKQDERVGWLLRADQAARAFDPSVKQATLEYTDEMLRFAVVNSEGMWMEDALPLLYFRVNVVADKNGQIGTGFERVSFRLGAEQMDNDRAGQAGREAARMAVVMADARPAPAGEMPVVLAAGSGVLFHEAVGHGLEGDSVYRGISAFAGRVGETVASPRVSILDYGGIPELRGSYNMDDEGTPPMQNILIEKGVLRSFMTDRIASQALDMGRSGNGRRQSYRFPPLVRMSNTFLFPGTDEVSAIVSETKNGLFAAALGGGEVDTSSGNFTFGVREAYLIEDGKITAPVRGANLVGNGSEILKRIDRVGPDQKYWNGTCGKGQWVPVTSGSPTLRVSSMTVGGSDES